LTKNDNEKLKQAKIFWK